MAVTFPSNPINGQTFLVGDVTYTYSGGMWSSQIGATNPSTGPSTSEYTYTAANNQTSFSGADSYGQTMAYTAGQIGVFLNGVRLVANTDYTATNGTTVTLTEGTSANDILAVQNIVNVSNGLGSYFKTYNYDGTLEVATGSKRLYLQKDFTLTAINSFVDTAPVGSSIEVDINKNGSSLTTTSIANGANSSSNTGLSYSITANDYITVDITQVGADTAGENLSLVFTFEY